MILPNAFIVLGATIMLGALGLCGIIAGWGSSRVLGLRWSTRTWLADGALAVGVSLALALTIGSLTRGNGPAPSWLALAATLSVVIRHVARRFVGGAPARRTS